MSAHLLPVAAGAVAAMLIAVSLREIKREYAVILSLTCAVLLMIWGVNALLPAVEMLDGLLSMTESDPSRFELLLKALGISICTQLASDVCKDAGEGAIASKVEFCGRVCLLLLSIPLLQELLAIAGEILSS